MALWLELSEARGATKARCARATPASSDKLNSVSHCRDDGVRDDSTKTSNERLNLRVLAGCVGTRTTYGGVVEVWRTLKDADRKHACVCGSQPGRAKVQFNQRSAVGETRRGPSGVVQACAGRLTWSRAECAAQRKRLGGRLVVAERLNSIDAATTRLDATSGKTDGAIRGASACKIVAAAAE
eukprot:3647317-Pleurochrysis_carterae.AAC.2